MKHLLSKLGCVVIALILIVSFFAIVSGNSTYSNNEPITFVTATNAAGNVIYMEDEVADKLAGLNVENVKPSTSTPASTESANHGECDFKDHVFGEPVIVVDDMYPTIYKRGDTCAVCGYYIESNWAIYIPEDATEIPAPGGENDIFLGVSEGFGGQ